MSRMIVIYSSLVDARYASYSLELIGTITEDGGADTHHGTSFFDRHEVVVGHTHTDYWTLTW